MGYCDEKFRVRVGSGPGPAKAYKSGARYVECIPEGHSRGPGES